MESIFYNLSNAEKKKKKETDEIIEQIEE